MSRKAAYRALTELSEWLEAQKEKAEGKARALEEEQKRVCTFCSG